MGRTRQLILAVLVVFVGFCIYRGVTPAKWKSIYYPAANVVAPNTQVEFSCGAPWGTKTVKAPANLIDTPIEGTPCGSHTSDAVMLGVSVVLGAGGIFGVIAWPRRRDDDEADVKPVEPTLGVV